MSGESVGAASASGQHKKPLLIAFAITFSYMIVEVVGGIVTGSLALISDAAHMGTDVIGLGMALAAIRLGERPATLRRSYGSYRLEVLAALANSVLLFGVAFYVLYEAYQRFKDPPEVLGVPMLVVAVVGLIINLISFRLLLAGSKDSLNVKGAFLEVLSDLLGSIGVIVAAIIVATTGWSYADPIIGAAIGLFILPRTWKLGSQAVRILMEAAPDGLDVDEVRQAILAVDGVTDVHDLHVWVITSGMNSATAHVTVASPVDPGAVLDRVADLLATRYQIPHATIQVEPVGRVHPDQPV